MYGRHLKILGISLLASVGVMAISASAAQAKWLLLRNGVSVLLLSLTGNVLLSEIIVNPFGVNFQIHCTGGTATGHLQLSSDHKKLTGGLTGTFTGCIVLNFPKCTVKSPGAAAGTIVASGEGEGKMNGEEVFALLEDSEFTSINIEGALCALNEHTEEVISGRLKFSFVDPLKDETTKLVKLDEDGVFCGEEPATIEGELLEVGKPRDPWVLAHVQEKDGASFALHLVGL